MCGGLQEHIVDILNATTSALRRHFATLTEAEVGIVVSFCDLLKHGVVEILKVKTSYLFHPSYLFLGALCNDATYGGGSLSEAKKFVQRALAERDAALLAGKRSELNRVTVLLSVGENNECRITLEQFAASPDEKLSYMVKYILDGYADGSVISTRVEATHSHIKGHQKRADVESTCFKF